MDEEPDFDIEIDLSAREESCSRDVPFPVVCRSIINKKYSKKDLRRAFGSMVSVKLPIDLLYATQKHVSPIGVERFVLLAMAGILVPTPVIIHFEGKHIIHEGHHRLTALHDLGADVVHVQLVDLGGSLWTPDGG